MNTTPYSCQKKRKSLSERNFEGSPLLLIPSTPTSIGQTAHISMTMRIGYRKNSCSSTRNPTPPSLILERGGIGRFRQELMSAVKCQSRLRAIHDLIPEAHDEVRPLTSCNHTSRKLIKAPCNNGYLKKIRKITTDHK